MDGIHDLGGRQGFGPVRHMPDAPAFHAAWEKRINALYGLAVRRGVFNMDEYRHAIERMEPRHYLSASYYERTLTSLATLCVEKGIVTREELERRAEGAFPLALPAAAGRTNVATRPRLAVGDRVRVRDDHVPGHVRMPAYIRGKRGVVVGVSPAYPFPGRACAWRGGGGRADLRRALRQHGALAGCGGAGDGACGGVRELSGARRLKARAGVLRAAGAYHASTMSDRTRPPFRADHVGSFLRPKHLLEAREQKAKGEITRRAAARGRGPTRSPRS